MEKVGLSILNYNDSERVLNLVKHSLRCGIFDEIVIVDNNSSEEQKQLLKSETDSRVHIIYNEVNKGFACGTNTGLKYLIYDKNVDFAFIANSDIMFKFETINNCLNRMIENQNLGAVSTYQIENNGSISCTASKKPSFWRNIKWMFYLWRRKHTINIPDKKDDAFYKTFMLRGSFICFRNSCLKQCGFFDEDTFLYYEEAHIFAKINRCGFDVGVISNDIVKHMHKDKPKGTKIPLLNHKYTYQGAYSYFTKYEKIGFLKRFLFKVCATFSLLEIRFINLFKKKY